MERVTVEQNGERFTLQVPDGTSDEDIQTFLANQTGAGQGSAPASVSPAPYIAAQTPAIASGTARSLLSGAATANARDALNIAKNATSWTPNAIMQVVSHPINAAQAYVAGHPWANTPVKQIAGGIGKNIAGAAVQGVMAPENLLTVPYAMSAYEQEKIRQNPNAPGLERNPYAMSYRSQSTTVPMTQGQAGAMNQRNLIANLPYGNVNAQERAILEQDRIQKQQVQAQAQAVLQQQPTSQNFIERMKALSTLYKPATE
jgi:ElaB/YqjD/DUF883 family membrane-anchored ribosome-binding protein